MPIPVNPLEAVVQYGHSCQIRSVSPAGNRCRFVLLDNGENCPTADQPVEHRPVQWTRLLDQRAVRHGGSICHFNVLIYI